MSAPEYKRIAVLDIGKTNAKVVVLDVEIGTEIATAKMPNRVISTGPYPHYDIDALWTFVLSALGEFAVEPGFDAISITTHGASAVLVDACGNLAMPVIDYEYQYPDEIREAYATLRPPFDETFSPPLSGGLNLGAQIHFLKTMFPDRFAEVAAILTYPQYWAFRLTGVMANEVTSLGCHTDLWNALTGDHSSLVDRLEIRTLMAPRRSAFDVLGPVLPRIAANIGLARSIPVYCGIHDSNASLLPHLLRREAPFAVVSTGTWVVSFAVGARVDGLDPTRDTLANVDAFGRPTPSARFMGGREFEILTATLPLMSASEINAATARVLSKSLMLLPSVVSGSGPFPDRTMVWSGQPADSAEGYAAASLYAAMMTAACLSLIAADGPTILEGPFCKNETYLQALADCTGRQVIVTSSATHTGTAQGAALLTGIAPAPAIERLILPGLVVRGYFEQWQRALVGKGQS
ncbi:MAG: FGGY-family carbohydrate kinase [Allorhizobium sp.]